MTRPLLAFVGTQGEGPGQGIHAIHLDPQSGALTDLGVVAEEERPTFTLPDPQRPVLYAVSEVGNRDARFGAIMSYQIAGQDGTLRPITRRRTGGGSTHLDLSASGQMLYCANFGGPNSVAVPVRADGYLNPISAVMTTQGTGPHKRQSKPHPHGVTLDPSGRWLLVPDMGADRIYTYRVEGDDLIPADPAYTTYPAGCGPRFVLFGPDGRFAYMLGELSAEIFQLSFDEATGALRPVAQIPLDPPGADHPPGAAAYGMSKDGRFLYVSNRGTHDIQVFAIAPETGDLTQVQRLPSGGERPWGLGISEDGAWILVANQLTGNVASFRVDPATGTLTATGHSIAIDTPTSAAFVSQSVMNNLA